MRQRRERRHRRLAAGVLLLAPIATACADGDSGPRSPVDYFEVAPHEVPLDLGQVFDPSDTELVGPHFAVALASNQVLPELEDDLAASYGLASGVAPVAGHEVLLAQFGAEYGREPLDPAPIYTTFAVEVGDDTVEVPEPVAPGDLWALVVPVDEPALMTVVDDDVRFSIDLRSGERVDYLPDLVEEPVATAAYQEPFDLDVVGLDLAGTGDLIADFQVHRRPWHDFLAWAEDGETWYVVDASIAEQWDVAGSDDADWFEWHNDPEDRLTLRNGDRVLEPERVTELAEQDAEDTEGIESFTRYEAVFRVPTDAGSLRLHFAPGGTGFFSGFNAGFQADISQKPPARSFPLEFHVDS